VIIRDVIIVGGGPAGLSAALILGRCRRDVLVCDMGEPRNSASRHLHGFLSRDRTPPGEFLREARAELNRYPSVEYVEAMVETAFRHDDHFELGLSDGRRFACRKLLLATGVADELPALKGLPALYGTSVFHCPYCDGFESRDRAIAVYGQGQRGLKLALHLLGWSRDLVLFTDGDASLDRMARDKLERNRIRLREEKVEELESEQGALRAVVLQGGERVPRAALFFNTPSHLHSRLMKQLGCRFSDQEGVETGKYECTGVPGLYAAGNILRDVQLAIVAAADGARAAFGINQELSEESLK
jgi:thioredoxin reductase